MVAILLKTRRVTSAPLGRLQSQLSEIVELTLSAGRRIRNCRNFSTVAHLSAALSEYGRNHLSESHRITATPLGELRTILSESVVLALPEGRRLGFRMVPPLPSVFSEDDINHLLRTHHVTSAPLGIWRAVLSEIVDLALPYGTHLDFRAVPHLPSAISEEGRDLLLKTHQITDVHLGKLLFLLTESVELAHSDGRNLNPSTLPHLPAVFSEEVIYPLAETHQITSAPLGESRPPTVG